MILRISGLPGTMNNDEFWQLVHPFGTVRSAHLVFDPITYKCKRFGLVHLMNRNDGLRMIEELHGKAMANGQVLKVQEVQKNG